MPYLPIVVCVAFAVFFYRAAEFEDEPAFIWCGLSVVISVLALLWLHWGWMGIILSQAALFAGITIVRMLRK